MQQVEVALGATVIAIEAGRLVSAIAKKIGELQGNRAEDRCKRLMEAARQLKTLLEERDQSKTEDSIGVFNDALTCLGDIKDYVEHTKDNGLISDAVEVWWRQRYHNILARAEKLRDVFTIGPLSRTDFNPLRRLGPDGKVRPTATFILTNPSEIEFRDKAESRGKGRIPKFGAVVCHRLKDSPLSLQSLGLYTRLQDRYPYVQQLRGVAEIKNKLYVFFQDCSLYKTLNQLCVRGELPCDPSARLDIAYGIARTFARCHHYGVILKAMSDKTVVMDTWPPESNRLTPVLTGLEHMRNLYELSAGLRYDRRYEAPEYDPFMAEHTQETDIWCLGILVWQTICGKVPYGMESPVDSDNETDAGKIREFLARNVEPGTFSDTVGLPPDLISGLRTCWNRDPKQRPTAASVSRMLCDSMYRLRHAHDEVVQPDPDAADRDGHAKTRALSLVAQCVWEEEKKDLIKKSKKSKKKDLKDKGDGDTPAPGAGRLVSQVPAAVREDKITAQEVQALIRASEAQCAYLVGASVWWSLLDEEALRVAHGSRSAEFTTTADDGQRAELALMFLQRAVLGGCAEGHFEMHKAYALLSALYKDKHCDLSTKTH